MRAGAAGRCAAADAGTRASSPWWVLRQHRPTLPCGAPPHPRVPLPQVMAEIELGNGLPDVRTCEETKKALAKAGFEVIDAA